MKFSTLFLRLLNRHDERRRMEVRRRIAEAEARSIELDMTVNTHHDTLVEMLRRSFQGAKHD